MRWAWLPAGYVTLGKLVISLLYLSFPICKTGPTLEPSSAGGYRQNRGREQQNEAQNISLRCSDRLEAQAGKREGVLGPPELGRHDILEVCAHGGGL